MVEYKLSNVLLHDDDRFHCYPALFCRATAPVRFKDGDVAVLSRGAQYDFSTFLGSLSWGKWRMYTSCDNAHLRLRIAGKGEIIVYGFDYQYEFHVATRHVLMKRRFDGEMQEIDIDVSGYDHDVVSFGIVCDAECEYGGAYWYSNVAEDDIHDVELSICITTFKKEDYVLPNVRKFEELAESGERIAKHFQVHVVDNGRTLGGKISDNDRIFVHPNRNAGGAGGFARGMIESIEAECKPTHILVMDDDISVLPEAFIRTYNLLGIVNAKYRSAFLSGAMMSMQVPNEQFEDVGHITAKGHYETVKRHFNMFEINDVCENEALLPTFKHQYAAFWFCCFPIGEAERGGLPLPLFVRGDDAEFGLRNPTRRFMTMNGICVWHDAFGPSKFRAHMECYMSVRNSLILQSVSPSYRGDDLTFFDTLASDHIERELRKFSYNNVELVLMAIEDYLRGPDYLMSLDCEAKLKEVLALNEKSALLGDFVEGDMDDLWVEEPRGFVKRAVMALTRNGQRMCPDRMINDEPIAVPNDFLWSPVNRMHLRRTLIMVNEDKRTGVVHRRDDERFKTLYSRWQKDRKAFLSRKDKVAEEWRSAYPRMKSIEFWKAYLGI